jgi:hypothetical protein
MAKTFEERLPEEVERVRLKLGSGSCNYLRTGRLWQWLDMGMGWECQGAVQVCVCCMRVRV